MTALIIYLISSALMAYVTYGLSNLLKVSIPRGFLIFFFWLMPFIWLYAVCQVIGDNLKKKK